MSGVPPCWRTTPAALLEAPCPARSRSTTTVLEAPSMAAKTDAHPPMVPAPTTTTSADSRALMERESEGIGSLIRACVRPHVPFRRIPLAMRQRAECNGDPLAFRHLTIPLSRGYAPRWDRLKGYRSEAAAKLARQVRHVSLPPVSRMRDRARSQPSWVPGTRASRSLD